MLEYSEKAHRVALHACFLFVIAKAHNREQHRMVHVVPVVHLRRMVKQQ